MTVRERILALKLLEKEERNPEYAKQIGVHVSIKKKRPRRDKAGGQKNVI